ncbi:hypothetical protein ACOMHN_002134 [Nucella lapillus]
MPQRKGWQGHLLYPPHSQPYLLALPTTLDLIIPSPLHTLPPPQSNNGARVGHRGLPYLSRLTQSASLCLGWESEVDSEAEPFHDIPELGDVNLSGAGVALSKQKYRRVPSDQAESLWQHAAGMETSRRDWRPAKASRIVAVYTGHDRYVCWPVAARVRQTYGTTTPFIAAVGISAHLQSRKAGDCPPMDTKSTTRSGIDLHGGVNACGGCQLHIP